MRLMQNGLIQLQSNILAIDSIDGVISCRSLKQQKCLSEYLIVN